MQAIVTLEFIAHRLFQLDDPVRRRILGFPCVDRGLGSGFDRVRRVEIRLSRAKRDDILARSFLLCRHCGDRDSRRRLDTGQVVGKKCHEKLPMMFGTLLRANFTPVKSHPAGSH